MAVTLSDGRPLDDAQPQDIARELGAVFERLSLMIANGGPCDAHRQETVELLARASAIMRAWAAFGSWTPRRFTLAEKVAAKITPGHVQALRFASEGTRVDPELRELATLLPDLLRHLKPESR